MSERSEIKMSCVGIAIVGISLMFVNYMLLNAGVLDHVGEANGLSVLAGTVIVIGIIGFLYPEKIVLHKIGEK